MSLFPSIGQTNVAELLNRQQATNQQTRVQQDETFSRTMQAMLDRAAQMQIAKKELALKQKLASQELVSNALQNIGERLDKKKQLALQEKGLEQEATIASDELSFKEKGLVQDKQLTEATLKSRETEGQLDRAFRFEEGLADRSLKREEMDIRGKVLLEDQKHRQRAETREEQRLKLEEERMGREDKRFDYQEMMNSLNIITKANAGEISQNDPQVIMAKKFLGGSSLFDEGPQMSLTDNEPTKDSDFTGDNYGKARGHFQSILDNPLASPNAKGDAAIRMIQMDDQIRENERGKTEEEAAKLRLEELKKTPAQKADESILDKEIAGAKDVLDNPDQWRNTKGEYDYSTISKAAGASRLLTDKGVSLSKNQKEASARAADLIRGNVRQRLKEDIALDPNRSAEENLDQFHDLLNQFESTGPEPKALVETQNRVQDQIRQMYGLEKTIIKGQPVIDPDKAEGISLLNRFRQQRGIPGFLKPVGEYGRIKNFQTVDSIEEAEEAIQELLLDVEKYQLNQQMMY